MHLTKVGPLNCANAADDASKAWLAAFVVFTFFTGRVASRIVLLAGLLPLVRVIMVDSAACEDGQSKLVTMLQLQSVLAHACSARRCQPLQGRTRIIHSQKITFVTTLQDEQRDHTTIPDRLCCMLLQIHAARSPASAIIAQRCFGVNLAFGIKPCRSYGVAM